MSSYLTGPIWLSLVQGWTGNHRCPLTSHRLVSLVVTASASRAVDPRFESRLPHGADISAVELVQGLDNWYSQCATSYLTPRGIIGSALGLVGPVSVYCEGEVEGLTCNLLSHGWQHVKLSVQIRP